MILGVLVMLFLLSSCSSQNNFVDHIHSGTKGLVIDFSKSTPLKIYENSSFFARLRIRNLGAFNVPESNPGRISLVVDKAYLTYDPSQWDYADKSVYLEGKSRLYPRGNEIFFDLPEFKVKPIPGNIQNPRTNIFVGICYPYQTFFADRVCIDFDPYHTNERGSVCEAKPKTYSNGQGGPISITKITPISVAHSGSVKPRFLVELKNNGNGIPAFSDTFSCDDSSSGSWNIVKVEGKISNTTLNCQPNPVKLIDNRAEIQCIAEKNFVRTSDNYFSQIQLNISYFYMDGVSKSFKIIRTKEYEPYIYSPSESCLDKKEGDSCGNNMVCNPNSVCVDKCKYCAEDHNSPFDCKNVTYGWSCSCSDDMLSILDKQDYVKDFCQYKTCCNLNKQPRVYFKYKEKDPEDLRFNSAYKLITDSFGVVLNKDYRVRLYFTNPNMYCKLIVNYSNTTISSDLEPCSRDVHVDFYTANNTRLVLTGFVYSSKESSSPIAKVDRLLEFKKTHKKAEPKLPQSTIDFVNKIKQLDLNKFHTMWCAEFIQKVMRSVNNNHLYQSCQQGDAWTIVAKYLTQCKDNVIYSGPPLSYSEAKKLIQPGDLIFYSNKRTWCIYSGYNAYIQPNYPNFDINAVESACSGRNGSDALRKNDPTKGFCKKDTFNPNPPKFDATCTFDEAGVHVENFPIVTHIMLVYKTDPEVLVMHQPSKTVKKKEKLSALLNRMNTGIRVIVRPDYSGTFD